MKLNIRRLDRYNYVVEEIKQSRKSSREYTTILGYYGNLDSLLTHSLAELPFGDSAEELRIDLHSCKKELIRALYDAIESGALKEELATMSDGAREGLARYRERRSRKRA